MSLEGELGDRRDESQRSNHYVYTFICTCMCLAKILARQDPLPLDTLFIYYAYAIPSCIACINKIIIHLHVSGTSIYIYIYIYILTTVRLKKISRLDTRLSRMVDLVYLNSNLCLHVVHVLLKSFLCITCIRLKVRTSHACIICMYVHDLIGSYQKRSIIFVQNVSTKRCEERKDTASAWRAYC